MIFSVVVGGSISVSRTRRWI